MTAATPITLLPRSRRWAYRIGLALSPLLLWAGPTVAAERILLRYGPLEFSLRVSSLADYATHGRIAPDLRDFTRQLNDAQVDNLRTILRTRVDLEPLALSQFLYSPQGEVILRQLGELIQTQKGESGFYALRAALILAAADADEGLTALNVLEKFPLAGLRVNSALALAALNEVSRTVQETNQVIGAIQAAAAQEAAAAAEPFTRDLRQPGDVLFDRTALILNDVERARVFPVDFYRPQPGNYPTGTLRDRLPLVVISHGLGGDRQTYAYLAEHLASHGIAVAVPEHPGSSASQLQDLASGLTRDVTPPQELIDRPLDIRFILDELAQRYGDRLASDRVAVIGQSFGAYTALVLAGAQLDFEHLEAACEASRQPFNLSLLLQCAAQSLPGQEYDLGEPRVAAVLAINPLGSVLFGPRQLTPVAAPTVAIVAGSADTVTPALAEQIRPFATLASEYAYLILMQGGTHFSTLGVSDQDVPLPAAVVGPEPVIARDYIKALSLALVEAELLGRQASRAYLTAAYAQALSQDTMPLTLTRSLPPRQR